MQKQKTAHNKQTFFTMAVLADSSSFSLVSRRRTPEKTMSSSALRRRQRNHVQSHSSYSVDAANAAQRQPHHYPETLRAMCTAVQKCSELTSKTQASLANADRVNKKSDDSPVTVADYAAQAVVTYILEQTFPSVGMLAEEDGSELRTNPELLKRVAKLTNECMFEEEASSSSSLSEEEVLRIIDRGGRHEGGSDSTFFVLDPIDGTKGFINQRQYAIALGLCENGRIVGGVLGCPNMPMGKSDDESLEQLQTEKPGVVFCAYENLGCWYSLMDAEEPLGKDSFLATSDAFVKSGKDGARYMESWGDSIVADHAFTNELSEKIGITKKPLRVDSQAKYGSLSRGDTHIYLRFPPKTYREKVWDHAAGAIIVSESGGVISDASGEPLQFGKGRFLDINGGIVASATPALHQQLINAIASLRK